MSGEALRTATAADIPCFHCEVRDRAVCGALAPHELRRLNAIVTEVRLEKNNVTVGQSGHIKADIYGRSIRVEGAVEGNLYGGEEVVIRASGRVQGNIVSPSVTLENGSKFKGAIDMEPGGKSAPASSPKPAQPPAEPKPVAPAAKPTAAPSPSRG